MFHFFQEIIVLIFKISFNNNNNKKTPQNKLIKLTIIPNTRPNRYSPKQRNLDLLGPHQSRTQTERDKQISRKQNTIPKNVNLSNDNIYHQFFSDSTKISLKNKTKKFTPNNQSISSIYSFLPGRSLRGVA